MSSNTESERTEENSLSPLYSPPHSPAQDYTSPSFHPAQHSPAPGSHSIPAPYTYSPPKYCPASRSYSPASQFIRLDGQLFDESLPVKLSCHMSERTNLKRWRLMMSLGYAKTYSEILYNVNNSNFNTVRDGECSKQHKFD